MKTFHFSLPLSAADISQLKAGDMVFLTGHLYTARDAAHKRMAETLSKGLPLPFELSGETIYYAGPAPARPGKIIGPCGPTTAGRMDAYTPLLLDAGLKVMIGKGKRNNAVRQSIVRNQAVYLGIPGGAAALISTFVTACELIAYKDLGTEAIRMLEIKELPAFVLLDSFGNDLYESTIARYADK